MKKNVFLALACLSSTLFLSSCYGTKSYNKYADASKVFSGEWDIVSINSEVVSTESTKAPTMVFNWDEKRIAGKTGCNSYFADFEVKNGNIKFDKAATTKMLCIETQDIENEFLDAFNQITNYKVDDEKTIQFLNADGKTIMEAKRK